MTRSRRSALDDLDRICQLVMFMDELEEKEKEDNKKRKRDAEDEDEEDL